MPHTERENVCDSNDNLFTCPFESLTTSHFRAWNLISFVRNCIDWVFFFFFLNVVPCIMTLPASDSHLVATTELFVFVTDMIIHLYLIRMGEICIRFVLK